MDVVVLFDVCHKKRKRSLGWTVDADAPRGDPGRPGAVGWHQHLPGCVRAARRYKSSKVGTEFKRNHSHAHSTSARKHPGPLRYRRSLKTSGNARSTTGSMVATNYQPSTLPSFTRSELLNATLGLATPWLTGSEGLLFCSKGGSTTYTKRSINSTGRSASRAKIHPRSAPRS